MSGAKREFPLSAVAALSFALLGAGTWFAQTRNVTSSGARAPASVGSAFAGHGFGEGIENVDMLAGIGEFTIRVTRATWSGKDVTDVVAKACDGKSNCDYEVSRARLRRATHSSDKSFSIAWTCGADGAEKTKAIPHDATDQHALLECRPLPVDVSGLKLRPDGIPYAYQSPSSFRARYLAGKGVNAACAAQLQAYYDSGKTLAAPLDLGTIEQESFVSKVRDREFYHYTNAPAMIDIADGQRMEEINSFVREKGYVYFYIAEDPDSTRRYGPIQIHLTLRPGARILEQARDQDGVLRFAARAVSAGLGDCDAGELTLLIMEDSDVDLIDYFTEHRWYRVMNPFVVERMEGKQVR